MMSRRELREHTFCILFSRDFYPEREADGQIKAYLSGLGEWNEEDTAEREWPKLPEISEEERKELETRIQDILSKIPELDEKINKASEGWKTSRMNRVDLTLIRLALYEITYDDRVPVKVAINEAVEIAKKYGGADSPSFVNGILARLVK